MSLDSELMKKLAATSAFELDHIGIAVRSLEEGLSFYKALGFTEHPVEEVASEDVRVAFLVCRNQTSIELLEPMSKSGPIGRFLDSRGPGIHHICVRVREIEAVAKKLVDAGVKLINETPRPGAQGCDVVFVHPKSAGGVLVELSEKRRSA